MKRILTFMKDYKKESILAPLFKMLEAFFELFVPLVVASIIDRGIGEKQKTYIFSMCLVLLLLAVIGLVCSVTAQYFSAKAAVGASTSMRQKLFEHIQTFGFRELDMEGSATLITRMTSDINQVQNGINLVLRLFLRSPFIVFGSMIMAFTIDVRAALVFVVTIPLLSIVVFGVMLVTKPLYKNIQAKLDKILEITKENLSGARVIRAFHQEDYETNRFHQENEELTRFQKFAGRISGLTNPLTFVIINLAIIYLLHTGAVRVNTGSLSQGQVVALYNYMSQILVELIKLANLIIAVTKALACAARINDIFEIEPAMKEGRSLLNENVSNIILSFSHVSFTYPGGGEEALTDISFDVTRGQTIGIIGGTGSGKSTLVSLIPRFYDATGGTITWNDRKIDEYSFEQLQKEIAVVPQKAQLFQGTIRENLRMGEDISDDRLKKALETSQAAEFVSQKEGGLDYVIEQGGKNLSGGQKQRLTLARALAKEASILIMDDSASALDYATDAKLRKAISFLTPKPTVFIVSQRTSSIMHADQILVMDDGKVAAKGSHEELLSTSQLYKEIYDTQFKQTTKKESLINQEDSDRPDHTLKYQNNSDHRKGEKTL